MLALYRVVVKLVRSRMLYNIPFIIILFIYICYNIVYTHVLIFISLAAGATTVIDGVVSYFTCVYSQY